MASDHILVYLQPQYGPPVQRQSLHTPSRWTPEPKEALRDCYTTDWHVVLGEHGKDIYRKTHCLTDYLELCVDAAPAKTVRCYRNEPWMTQDFKDVLNGKKMAFRIKDEMEIKAAKEVRCCLKEAKDSYRRKGGTASK